MFTDPIANHRNYKKDGESTAWQITYCRIFLSHLLLTTRGVNFLNFKYRGGVGVNPIVITISDFSITLEVVNAD